MVNGILRIYAIRMPSDRMYEIDLSSLNALDEIRQRTPREFGPRFTRVVYVSLLGDEIPLGDASNAELASKAAYCIAYECAA